MFRKVFSLSGDEFKQSLTMFVFKFLDFIVVTTIIFNDYFTSFM